MGRGTWDEGLTGKLYEWFLECERRVSTDSRYVERGSVFFALRGDNFDGNQYAAAALAAGASYAVVDDGSVDDNSGRYMVVDSVLYALQNLACTHRISLGLPIVALTGSNGKTTTKEFLRLALGAKFRVEATQGNFNNHIGVPLTLLRFSEQTELGIVEMGANHCNEIAALCAIAGPNVGLITNVGRAHLEGFGGEQGVRRGKGELFDYLTLSGGTAVYNAEDQTLCDMVAERKTLNAVAYYPSQIERGSSLFGQYNALNAAAAVAVAEFLGVDRAAAVRAVGNYHSDNNRSEVFETARGNTLVVDCYNANPSSMAAALGEFSKFDIKKPKVLILGQMRELGEYSYDEHRTVAVAVAVANFDQAYFVGDEFSFVDGCFTDTASLKEYLSDHPITGCAVLLKGSRSVRLEQLIENL